MIANKTPVQLISPKLSELVDSLDDGSHDCCGRDVDEALHIVDSLLLVQVETKLVLEYKKDYAESQTVTHLLKATVTLALLCHFQLWV